MSKPKTRTMRGFMCQSPAATAVCMTADTRSVIVPRRSERTLIDSRRLIDNAKYSRLVESPVLPLGRKRPYSVPCKKRGGQDPGLEPKALQKPSSLASSDNVFQVRLRRMLLISVLYSFFLTFFCSNGQKKKCEKQ